MQLGQLLLIIPFFVDAKGNTILVSGTILPIDVWSNNGVKYFIEFNDLCQLIRKGGHTLIRFIGMMAKMETHFPVGEEDWHAIDSHIKGKIVKDIRLSSELIKLGGNIGSHSKKNTTRQRRKHWMRCVVRICPERGKKARAFLNQYHRSDSNSFANQQADYEDEHGEKMSLLALWIKSYTGKDGSFLSRTDTNDFMDDLNTKVEQLRLKYPIKSQLELENKAFEEIIVLRKEGYGKIQRNIVTDSFKEELVALNKKMINLKRKKKS
ncbi:Cytochrome c oxidase subunit 7B mitochondrial [Bienertia sinuspersici]